MRSPSLFLVSTALLLAATGALGDESPKYEMGTSQMAFLSKAPDAKPLDERQIQAIQEGHLLLLRRLFEERKALIEGPIHGAGGIRSVLVLDVPTAADAEALLREDPWIASGQLQAEIHPWFSAKNILRKPASVDRTTLCYLGLLRRPADAPSFPKEKLEEIQAGHMANIQAMADSRDLAIAGPMGDDTALRGILVFRTTDPDHIRKLVERDPAVAAGRLRLDLLPWYVPEGTLPE
jgi:uncharacterized protein YciI